MTTPPPTPSEAPTLRSFDALAWAEELDAEDLEEEPWRPDFEDRGRRA